MSYWWRCYGIEFASPLASARVVEGTNFGHLRERGHGPAGTVSLIEI